MICLVDFYAYPYLSTTHTTSELFQTSLEVNSITAHHITMNYAIYAGDRCQEPSCIKALLPRLLNNYTQLRIFCRQQAAIKHLTSRYNALIGAIKINVLYHCALFNHNNEIIHHRCPCQNDSSCFTIHYV